MSSQFEKLCAILTEVGFVPTSSLDQFVGSSEDSRKRIIEFKCKNGHEISMKSGSLRTKLKRYERNPERICVECAPAKHHSAEKQFDKLCSFLSDIGCKVLSSLSEFSASSDDARKRIVVFQCQYQHQLSLEAGTVLKHSRNSYSYEICRFCKAYLSMGYVDECFVSMMMGAENGRVDFIDQALVRTSVDPSRDSNILIRIAARRGHDQVIERLLEDDRVDPSANHNAAIYEAFNGRHTRALELLFADERVRSTLNREHYGTFKCVANDGFDGLAIMCALESLYTEHNQ